MNERQWYYYANARQEGPVGESVLAGMFHSGRLRPDTMVWTQGLKDWVQAASVEGLLPHVPPPMPPPILSSFSAQAEPVSVVSYAGFWKRVVAVLIDGIILFVIGLVVGVVFGVIYAIMTGGSGTNAEALGNLLGVLTGWLYAAFFESSALQGTPGKMALGIKVTDLDGNRISFLRATGRHFGKIISALILFIGFLMVAFTARKQGLHDMLAGCLVINR